MNDPCWIDTVPFADAEGKLRKLYDRVTGPDGNVDNIMLAHSLRPHSMEGHMALYKAVLHHYANKIPKWFLEVIGVHVSLINRCAYCVEHHYAGLARLLGDADKAADMRAALEADTFDTVFSARESAALHYAGKLTRMPADMIARDIEVLRTAGFEDGEILEINQVTAYFGYANRTVLGLGITTDGDVLGLSPNKSDNPEDWSHS